MTERTKTGLEILKVAAIVGVFGNVLLRVTPWGLNAFLFVTGVSEGSSLAILARADCDPGLVAYEMGALVQRAAAMLTPALRVELHTAIAR